MDGQPVHEPLEGSLHLVMTISNGQLLLSFFLGLALFFFFFLQQQQQTIEKWPNEELPVKSGKWLLSAYRCAGRILYRFDWFTSQRAYHFLV